MFLRGDDPAIAYDFDGNGRQEIVIGVFDAENDLAKARDGEVLIHAGPGEAAPRSIPPGFTGVDDVLDDYGRGIASADFNGDGHADLALSSPRVELVAVRYGSEAGLSDAIDITIDGDQMDLPPRDRVYGWSLVGADLDDDGFAELIIGAPYTAPSGAVQILRGSEAGLSRTDPDRRITLSAPDGVQRFGDRLRIGDIDRAGGLDLVEGAPDAEVAGHLTYCLDVMARQSCRRVRQSGTSGSSSLAVADVNGDEFDDVVQGDTLDVAGSREEGKALTSGEVRVWRGGARGLAAAPERVTERGLGEPAADSDEFGAGVDAADLNGDRRAEIVAGAPGAERVYIIRRETGGYAARVIAGPAADTNSATEEDFGFGLALLDVTGARSLDLVIASPEADPKNAVRVIENAAASAELLPLPDLASEIRLASNSLIAIGRRAGG